MAKLFEEGTESSAGDLMAALQDLSNKGQSVLYDIKTTRGNTLFRFEQGLSALNARRQRAARVNAPDIACRFLVSDMLDIDQAKRVRQSVAMPGHKITIGGQSVSGSAANPFLYLAHRCALPPLHTRDADSYRTLINDVNRDAPGWLR